MKKGYFRILDEMYATRAMNPPCFTNEDLQKLPNILELIEHLKDLELDVTTNSSDIELFNLHPSKSIYYSDRTYANEANEDKFIVNRLRSGRFCFKPNLKSHRFLFRGQNQHYSLITSSFERRTADEKLLSNIQIGDFVSMLRTHPLFMMFERGIHLSPAKKPFFFEMNYYGIAQHYNFHTGMVDFTSDILAAAFFATTTNKGDDKYVVYDGDSKYGVVYVHNITPQATFTMCGYRTIGHQIYPRTGAQHGFCYQEDWKNIPVEKTVRPFFFRHDPKCSAIIFDRMKQGELLFPKDDLAEISNEIRHSNSVTGTSFSNNLYHNQDEMQVNLGRLKDMGIKIDWHEKKFFTEDMLKQYYENIKNGWWEDFCNPIVFEDKDEKELMESLLTLPKNPHYCQFFEPNQLRFLHYFNIEERTNVLEIRRKKECKGKRK